MNIKTINKNTDNRTNIITFRLGTEIFGIETDYIINIVDKVIITPIPGSPKTLKGVINLRGTILPLVNAHVLLEAQFYESQNSNYIVIEMQINNQNNKFAIEVDSVMDVIEIDKNDISQPPQLGIKFPPNYLKGIIKYNEYFILILNLDQTFNLENLYNKKYLKAS